MGIEVVRNWGGVGGGDTINGILCETNLFSIKGKEVRHT